MRPTINRHAQMTYSNGAVNPPRESDHRSRVNPQDTRRVDQAILSYSGCNYGPAVEDMIDRQCR